MEFENLIKLIDTVSASELTGFKYEEKGLKLQMSKGDGEVKVVAAPAAPLPAAPLPAGPAPAPAAEAPAPLKEETEEAAKPGKIVESPLVGTFYAAPAEDAEAFVHPGDRVQKGQVLGIIEAMKLMNEIECEYDGIVDAVLVENEQVVEYGQPLFRIRREA